MQANTSNTVNGTVITTGDVSVVTKNHYNPFTNRYSTCMCVRRDVCKYMCVVDGCVLPGMHCGECVTFH